MLIQFRFKNYKSFRDDTILDLSAAKITEFNDTIINVGNEKLLPVTAIYGANASGKSNVIGAFTAMHTIVTSPVPFSNPNKVENSSASNLIYTPFLFDSKTKNAETSFEVYFIDNKDKKLKTYNYGFTLNKDGIVEEWLNSKAKSSRDYRMIFYRNEVTNELDLSGIDKKFHDNIKVSKQKNILLVSLGNILNIDKLKMVYSWFEEIKIDNFGNPIYNMVLSSVAPDGFADDKLVQDSVVKYISTFDKSIIGFEIEKITIEEKNECLKINAIHKTIDGGTATIPLKQESDGTQKMFSLYASLSKILKSGGILFIDELNARLHPLLVRNFILTFLNKQVNTNNAQLIFTTHDSWQLCSNLLRRDEIWFTEKDTDGVSTLYSLVDFVDEDGKKIRKDESYEKNYLMGKYGAIPKLDFINMFEEE